jgi:hypothetical protein
MLFVSGARDALAELDLLKAVVEGLGEAAVLKVIPGADHSFKVPARSARTSLEAETEALDAAAEWMLARS